MLEGLIGKKVGMTQIFDESGERIPVTVVELGPVTVTQIKTKDKEGYDAVQIGFQPITQSKLRNVNKPAKGHFGENPPMKYLKEFKADKIEEIQIGQSFDVNNFQIGQYVDVAGISKGRGFAGVMKRWGFSGGPGSHGHRANRVPGSIGCSATPSRVFKGKKMPGHYGNKRITIQNLKVIDIKPELNAILIQGAIPGANGRLVEVKKSKKK